MIGRELKVFGTIDQAHDYIRKLVCEDCNRIGIYDWSIIDEVLRKQQHQYGMTQDLEFDDVGNITFAGCWTVYLKKGKS